MTLDHAGQLLAGNAIDAERMLEGVVPAEIHPSAPPAALRAQAIAARTELLSQLGKRHHGHPFLTCADQRCQVYAGGGQARPLAPLLRFGPPVADSFFAQMARWLMPGTALTRAGFRRQSAHLGGRQDPSLRARPDAKLASRPNFGVFAGGIDAGNIRAFLEVSAGEADAGRHPHARKSFRWTHDVANAEVEGNLRARGHRIGRLLRLELGAREPRVG